jgi:hypothetical protein
VVTARIAYYYYYYRIAVILEDLEAGEDIRGNHGQSEQHSPVLRAVITSNAAVTATPSPTTSATVS